VLTLRHAEHLELVLVPTDDDVQSEAAFADVVGRHHLLGGDDGVEQRGVHGAEAGDPAGRCEQRSRPGDGLERGALVVGLAAVALPAPDRQHEVDAGRIGHAREPEIVGPGAGPAFRDLGHRAAGRAVCAEQAELEPVAPCSGHSVAQGRVCIP
jgi:hypothetical protein